MGLLHNNINILDLDGTLAVQKNLFQISSNVVAFQDVPHPALYCEIGVLDLLKRHLQRLENGITLIGNGNYHYMSYLLLSKVKEDFTLILFDHHTDMMESSELISCGSWVLYALETYSRLKRVIIIGSEGEPHCQLEKYKSKVKIICPNDVFIPFIINEITTPTVYISIDKDVLRPSDAVTNWDQGEMSIHHLLKILQMILEEKHVLGVDVCGELPVSPIEQFRSEYIKAIKKNEWINLSILKTLLSTKQE